MPSIYIWIQWYHAVFIHIINLFKIPAPLKPKNAVIATLIIMAYS